MLKMAVLINSFADGGAEKVVKLLIERFYKDKIQIELICLEKENKYELNKNIKISYLDISLKNTSGIKKLFKLFFLAYKLYKYVKKEKIELIQSHLFRANYVNILSTILFKSKHKTQVVNHTIISRYKKEGLLGMINLFLIKKLYPYSDKIISVSNMVEKDMLKLFKFKNNMQVIYNPFDIVNIKKLSYEEITDFRFDINKKYIISLGRLIKLKRNQDLILSLKNLNSSIELIFIGDGEEKEELITLSKKLNLLNRVHFLGWKDNPYKYIKKSDVLVSTSGTESFGNIIVEAMACDTIVISSRAGGPEEIIENNKNGLLCDIGDIKCFEDSINKIFDNDELKKNLILNAYKSINKFNIDMIFTKYKKVLEIE